MPGTPSGLNHSSESQTCGRKRKPLCCQLVVEPLDTLLEQRALDLHAQVLEPQVEDLLVRQLDPGRVSSPSARPTLPGR